MKLTPALAAFFLASLSLGALQADDLISHWQTVANLSLNYRDTSTVNESLPQGAKMELTGNANAYTGVKFICSGPGPADISLWHIGQKEMDHLHGDHFAIIGEVSYEGVSPYGISSPPYLEMYCGYASSKGTKDDYVRTLADGGPMGRLDYTSDWREFWVPAIDPDGYKVYHISFGLHLPGRGTVSIRNVKVVQYSDAPVSTTSLPPYTLDWRSFLFGVSSTGLMLLVFTGMIFISHRMNKRRHERELRQIASLDS